MSRFKALFAYAMILLCFSCTFVQAEDSYDLFKRFKLLQDKLATEEFFRPFGHDFIIDANAGLNLNFLDVIDDAEAVAAIENEQDQLEKGLEFLEGLDKFEQLARISAHIGIPLPTFSLFGIKIVPDFRVSGNFGFLLAIRQEVFGIDLNGLGSDGIFSDDVNVDTSEPLIAGSKAVDLSLDLSLPKFFLYAKGDIKGGFLLNFSQNKSPWYGFSYLYGLWRTDIFRGLTKTALFNGSKVIKVPNTLNTTQYFAGDFRIGFHKKEFHAFLQAEELGLFEMQKRNSESEKLRYGFDPLFRLHSEFLYKGNYTLIMPFAGYYYRNGYGLTDGSYAGVTVGFHLWGERLGINLRAMMDPEHYTISPKIKLWLLQIEYSLKIPVEEIVDDAFTSEIHYLNIRISI